MRVAEPGRIFKKYGIRKNNRMTFRKNVQLNTSIHKRIIALIVIAIFLAMTILPEHHNHTDYAFHADCSACIKIHHQAISIDFSPIPLISYLLSFKADLPVECVLCPFFSPQINPRAPPSLTFLI